MEHMLRRTQVEEASWSRQCLKGALKDGAESAGGQTSVRSEGLAETETWRQERRLCWFLWAGTCKRGCQGWGWGGLEGHYEFQPLAEVGPRKAAPAQQQGRTW